MTAVLDATRAGDVSSTRRSSLRIALPLARAEVGRSILSPLVAVGIALTVVAFYGVIRFGSFDLYREDSLLGLMLWPLAGMVLIAANLAASRPRRHGTQELWDSLPSPPEARTLGHLLSLTGPVVLATLLLIGLTLVARVTGSTGWPAPAEGAIGVVLVACAGAVGIVFDRFVGRSFATPLVVLGIGILEGQLGSDRLGKTWHLLAPWTPGGGGPREVWVRPSGWHLVYLLGIGALLFALGVIRHRRSRPVFAVAITVLVVAAIGGSMQFRYPTRQQVAQAVAFVARPESFQRCDKLGDVRYCYYPRSPNIVAHWKPAVDGVLARVPAAVRARGLLVQQRPPGRDLPKLDPAIRSALPFVVPDEGSYVWPDDSAIHPDIGWCGPFERGSCELTLAVNVASWAVGFPLAPTRIDGHREGPATDAYDSFGQARAVVALWLAGASTPRAGSGLRPISPAATTSDGACRVACGGGAKTTGPYRIAFCDDQDETSVKFWPAELAAARMLLAMPAVNVASVIDSHWATLVDPSTKTDRLTSLFRLGPPAKELLGAPAIVNC